VALDLEGGGRVLIRPSGTEPKLKIYIDLPGETGSDLRAAEEAARAEADSIGKETARFLGL
jgi:phosphomannomutase